MERLKLLRTNAKLTQQEIASRLGVERSTYVKYERGSSDPPSSTLVRLADMFDVSVDYILGHDASRSAPPSPVTSAELSMLQKFRALPAESQSFVLRTIDSEYQAALGARSV